MSNIEYLDKKSEIPEKFHDIMHRFIKLNDQNPKDFMITNTGLGDNYIKKNHLYVNDSFLAKYSIEGISLYYPPSAPKSYEYKEKTKNLQAQIDLIRLHKAKYPPPKLVKTQAIPYIIDLKLKQNWHGLNDFAKFGIQVSVEKEDFTTNLKELLGTKKQSMCDLTRITYNIEKSKIDTQPKPPSDDEVLRYTTTNRELSGYKLDKKFSEHFKPNTINIVSNEVCRILFSKSNCKGKTSKKATKIVDDIDKFFDALHIFEDYIMNKNEQGICFTSETIESDPGEPVIRTHSESTESGSTPLAHGVGPPGDGSESIESSTTIQAHGVGPPGDGSESVESSSTIQAPVVRPPGDGSQSNESSTIALSANNGIGAQPIIGSKSQSEESSSNSNDSTVEAHPAIRPGSESSETSLSSSGGGLVTGGAGVTDHPVITTPSQSIESTTVPTLPVPPNLLCYKGPNQTKQIIELITKYLEKINKIIELLDSVKYIEHSRKIASKYISENKINEDPKLFNIIKNRLDEITYGIGDKFKKWTLRASTYTTYKKEFDKFFNNYDKLHKIAGQIISESHIYLYELSDIPNTSSDDTLSRYVIVDPHYKLLSGNNIFNKMSSDTFHKQIIDINVDNGKVWESSRDEINHYKQNSGKNSGFATNVKFYKEISPTNRRKPNLVGMIHVCPPYIGNIKDSEQLDTFKKTQVRNLIRTYEGILYQFFKAYMQTDGEICGLYLYPLCTDKDEKNNKDNWSSIYFKYLENGEYKLLTYADVHSKGTISRTTKINQENEKRFKALLTFYCLGQALEKMTNLFYNDLLRKGLDKDASDAFKKIDIRIILRDSTDLKIYETEFNKVNYDHRLSGDTIHTETGVGALTSKKYTTEEKQRETQEIKNNKRLFKKVKINITGKIYNIVDSPPVIPIP